ncbi:MAG: hypothetical protein M3N53_02145 [Actinomycetota bacterium]|nr:hypothetical protein [Actinomycetota bacterium]
MRRWLIVAGALLLLVIGATAVVARTGRGGGAIDSQTFRWTNTPVSTSSSEWTTIPELSLGTGCQEDASTTATVSLELAEGSSPVDVRVVMDDPLVVCEDCTEPEGVMRPGAVRFHGTSSFVFVTRRAVGGHGTAFDVQWRLDGTAPAQGSATLESGTLNLLWEGLDGVCY